MVDNSYNALFDSYRIALKLIVIKIFSATASTRRHAAVWNVKFSTNVEEFVFFTAH
jgi:hypothetical protein